MGFAATASYFEGRAKRERDPDVRKMLAEVAGFYRNLAGVVPGFPPGFDGRRQYLKADRWLERAEECRAIAEHLTDQDCREQMKRLADSYDRLAVAAA
jgi:acyl carrier protein phosphodiesterase